MSIYATPRLRPDDLVIPQGSDWGMQWPLLDADGSTLDTTGYMGRGQLRRSHTAAGEPLAALAVSVDAGTVSVALTAAETSAWAFRHGVYDIEIVAPDGRVTRVARGRFRVEPEVTR